MAKHRRVRRGREVYENLVARRRREGLTWRETAQAGGVPLPTLMDWARRLGASRDRGRGRRREAFVELAARAESVPVDRIEVVLRSGRRLLVPPGLRATALAEWVELLERPC